MGITFDGQQEGERVLFEIRPHNVVVQFAIAKVLVTAILFLILIVIIGLFSDTSASLVVIGMLITACILTAGIWWNKRYFSDTVTYITDRRIMRFERVSPFQIAKRALFWNEAMKAKAYEPNLILQKFNIGTLIIEPAVPADENVIVHHIHFAEDLANYIDKILFTFKNNPADLTSINPFIPKPRGHRG